MNRMVLVAVTLTGLALSALPVLAQSSSEAVPPPDASSAAPVAPAIPQAVDWQSVIDNQVQAFRDHDAAGALNDAGQVFQSTFSDPADFFTAIMTGGYQPIMDSQSDSFGDFKVVGPGTVLQRVSFVGKDQTLYDAIYEMGHEDAGWRVEAVQMVKAAGMGI